VTLLAAEAQHGPRDDGIEPRAVHSAASSACLSHPVPNAEVLLRIVNEDGGVDKETLWATHLAGLASEMTPRSLVR